MRKINGKMDKPKTDNGFCYDISSDEVFLK